jgi:putative alpha-1,2-mannosidase
MVVYSHLYVEIKFSMIPVEEIVKEGVLRFEMGSQPGTLWAK